MVQIFQNKDNPPPATISNFTFNTDRPLRHTLKSTGPVSRKNGSPSPGGSLSHFFAATCDFLRGRYGWPFFAWNCRSAFLKGGRFLGILRKTSSEKMPKNRMEKNRYAVFLFL
jgi:hypothetical protein